VKVPHAFVPRPAQIIPSTTAATNAKDDSAASTFIVIWIVIVASWLLAKSPGVQVNLQPSAVSVTGHPATTPNLGVWFRPDKPNSSLQRGKNQSFQYVARLLRDPCS
jgi:hypothetical protein